MAQVIQLNQRPRQGQYTYTSTIAGLTGGSTPEFALPSGTVAMTIAYVLAGAGSLQIQKSANDPREVQNQSSGSGIPQVWVNAGTASTGGTAQIIEGAGSPQMVRGIVTGGSGTDVLTICISASYEG